MDSNYKIISQLNPDRWDEYRQLRLEALKEAPEAFESSYEDVKKEPKIAWGKRLQKARKKEGQIIVFAETNNNLVGMAAAFWGSEDDSAELISLYVNKQHRRAGLGRKLTETVLKEVASLPQITKLKVGAYTTQKIVLKLYAKCGFSKRITPHRDTNGNRQVVWFEKRLR